MNDFDDLSTIGCVPGEWSLMRCAWLSKSESLPRIAAIAPFLRLVILTKQSEVGMMTHQISERGRAVKVKTRATVVCFRGDRVLLVSKDGCKWSLPGGRPSKEESFADAAGRELAEETSLSAKGLSFLFHVIGATTVHQVFAANIAKTAVARPGKEIERCQWFSIAEMDDIVVSTTTRQIVKSLLVSRRG